MSIGQNLLRVLVLRMSRIRVPLLPATAMSAEFTGENMTDHNLLPVTFFSSNTGTE